MDAEDFYESRRIKDDEMEDKFEERKAQAVAAYAKEITEIFRLAFANGGTAYRSLHLPGAVGPRGNRCAQYYSVSVLEVISEAVSYPDNETMRLLLEACTSDAPDLTAFKSACIKGYLDEHLDDLAESAADWGDES